MGLSGYLHHIRAQNTREKDCNNIRTTKRVTIEGIALRTAGMRLALEGEEAYRRCLPTRAFPRNSLIWSKSNAPT